MTNTTQSLALTPQQARDTRSALYRMRCDLQHEVKTFRDDATHTQNADHSGYLNRYADAALLRVAGIDALIDQINLMTEWQATV